MCSLITRPADLHVSKGAHHQSACAMTQFLLISTLVQATRGQGKVSSGTLSSQDNECVLNHVQVNDRLVLYLYLFVYPRTLVA